MVVRSPDERLTISRTPPAATELVAAGGVAALGVACLLDPAGIEDGPVICPFRRLTGLPCPGCGLTRSWVYLTHGWWRDSFLAHPFGALLVVVVLALAAAVVRSRLTHRPAPDLNPLVRHPVAVAVISAWLLFGVARLAVAAT